MAIPNPGYWYINSVAYTAVTAWATGTVKAVGAMVRQLAAPSVGNERVFICITAGTTHATTEPTWVLTKGATTTDNTVTWMECTGQPPLNGSLTYTSGWTSGPGGVGTGVKAQVVAAGYIIARDNGASYQICTTGGTAGSGAEPGFSNTAGTTTSDNTVTWTSLGVVGGYTTAFGAPHARLGNSYATNWGAPGDNFWVGDNHAETQSTVNTITSPGTNALPTFTYCVDHTKTSPGTGDLLTTATITTTGNSNMVIVGYGYWNGIIFNAGSGAVAATLTVCGTNVAWQRYDNCSLRKLGTTNASAAVTIAASGQMSTVTLVNTTAQFGATGDGFRVTSANFFWRNTASALLGTIPTNVFAASTNSVGQNMYIDGVDLSAAGAGKTIGPAAGAGGMMAQFVRCKLGASVTPAVTPTVSPASRIDFISCSNTTDTTQQARYWYQGTLTNEETIVRSGGASDGTTPMSWKVVATANTTWTNPFETFPIAIWNSVTGSTVTATIEIINDGTTLNNDDVWAEVEYLGSALTPQASFANNTKANNLATGSAITTSTATWTTTGIVTPVKQKIVITMSSPAPQFAGYLRAIVYVAKASQTLWIDPLIALS